MKCQGLSSEKNKKNMNLLSKFFFRVAKVKIHLEKKRVNMYMNGRPRYQASAPVLSSEGLYFHNIPARLFRHC